MTTRELPVDEWPKLAGTELEFVWPLLDPAIAKIIVVEDEAGKIVGCWSFQWYAHAECVWTAPEHRHKGAVARLLLREMKRLADEEEVPVVWTSALTPDVEDLIDKLGGVQMPGTHFAVPVGRA